LKPLPIIAALLLVTGCTQVGGINPLEDPGPTAAVPPGSQGVVFGHGLEWSELEPWNTPHLRRSFLLGMTEASHLLARDETGFETFWPSETRAESVYYSVAKLYARDLGLDPAGVAPVVWRAAVAKSLRASVNQGAPKDLKGCIAYLAGLYARRGSPDGFQFSGVGFGVAELLGRHGDEEFVLRAQPGYPGGTTITIVGKNGQRARFFTLMEWVEAGVQKESVPGARGR
jgi:hypothetical protein